MYGGPASDKEYRPRWVSCCNPDHITRSHKLPLDQIIGSRCAQAIDKSVEKGQEQFGGSRDPVGALGHRDCHVRQRDLCDAPNGIRRYEWQTVIAT